MKQRKPPSRAVDLGSSLDFEADSAIERDCPFVLFVDVNGRRTKFNHRMPRKPSTDALAMERGIDKERVHLPSRHTNKSDEAAVRIADAVQVVERKQRLEDERLEELNVGLRQEIVRRSDGRLPDFEDTITLFCSYHVYAVLKHDLVSHNQFFLRYSHSATATIHTAFMSLLFSVKSSGHLSTSVHPTHRAAGNEIESDTRCRRANVHL